MKKKQFIILAAVIAALAALLVLLTVFGGKNTEKQPNEDSEKTSISIMNFNDDVVRYTVENNNGSSSFVKKDSKWTVESSPDIELDQNYVTASVAKASFMYAKSLVEKNSGKLSGYGFDTPSATVTLEAAAGNKAVIRFGKKTATESGYYAVVNDSSDVYIVETGSVEKVAGNLDNFRIRNLYNFDYSSVTHFSLESDKYTINIGKRTKNDPNQSNLSSWVMETPYKKPVNSNIFEENVLKVINFTVVDFTDDNPSDYTKYGLNPPKYTISVLAEGKSFTIYLGSDAGSGKIYARIKDKPNVFTISSDSVKYKDFTPVYLLESLVFVRNISAVDSIDFKSDNLYHFSSANGRFFADGKETDEKNFRKMYSSLISAVISGEADGSKIGAEICSFTFNYNTGTPSETVVYYEYGDMYAAVKINGKIEFYVKRKFAEDIVESVKNLVQ